MKKFSTLRDLTHIFVCYFLTANALSQSVTCDGIAEQVTSAVSKEPLRVLMIVEDALVINEKCACEIIRAAILASKADSELAKQIVQTAISVTPKMSEVIMDCASSASPGAQIMDSKVSTELSGKEVKNPVMTTEPIEEDFSIPSSIRGIYLMQPPAGGFLPRTCEKECISATQSIPSYP